MIPIPKKFWKPVLLIAVLGLFYFAGWNHHRLSVKENSVKQQAKIDKANSVNKDLRSDLILVNNAHQRSQDIAEIELEKWKAKHESIKPAPPSKCVGEDDYIGEVSANEFIEKPVNDPKKGLLRYE